MARNSSCPDYVGALAEPIYEPIPAAGLLGDGEQLRKEATTRAFVRAEEKLPLLFSFFDIAPDSEDKWRLLSLCLALSHVPGMRVNFRSAPKRGRSKTWQAGLGEELVVDVQILMAGSRRTTRSSIENLRKNKNKEWHLYSQQSLEARYREAMVRRRKRRALVDALSAPPWATLAGLYGLSGTLQPPSIPLGAGPGLLNSLELASSTDKK